MDFRKNSKFMFYLKGISTLAIPSIFYQRNLDRFLTRLRDDAAILTRVNYYNQVDCFDLSSTAIAIKYFSGERKTTYFFDLLRYLKYFNGDLKILYLFGDVRHVPNTPTLVKSRPTTCDNRNSVLMKLNSTRHFVFVDDKRPFEDKKNMLVWRGKCYRAHRTQFVKDFHAKEFCDVGQTNTKGDLNVPWQKERLSIRKQLEYKFILAIEGNDVASNLKWAMSSNSLVFMTKPKYETWFMEGTLKPDYHYVLLHDDYSNLESKVKYYSAHTNEARQLIANAQRHVEQFCDAEKEDLISLLVLQKYFQASNQLPQKAPPSSSTPEICESACD